MSMQPTRLGAIALALALIAFAGSCGKEDLYEIPDSPYPLVGRLPLPSINESVAVIDDYAFVAAGQAGMHIVDIGNPRAPVLVKTVNTTKYAENIKVLRSFVGGVIQDIAMIVEGTEGVTTYDITDPLSAATFNQGTTAVDGNGMFLLERENPEQPFILFLAESWKGVRVFESSPAYPGLLAYNGVFASTNGYAMGIAVQDGYAYVADDQMGLAVLDARVLVLDSVELVAFADTPGNALAVAIWDGHAFVADKRQGMSIFRINGGEAPVPVARMPLDGWCVDIAVRDDLAFVAGYDAGLHVVDVSDPAHPRYAGNVRSSNATGVTLTDGGLVLVTDEDDGLLILAGAPFADLTPPGGVYTLNAEAVGGAAIRLRWKAPGDDRYFGEAQSYALRYATAPIADEAAWTAATPVTGLPLPATAGSAQEFTVGGLTPETEYHFALRATDDEGLQSGLGAGASASTFPDGTFLFGLAVTPAFGDDEEPFTFTVSYSDPEGDVPVVHDLVIDATPTAMSYVSGDHATSALYRLETTLAPGAHSFHAAFDDGDGHTPTTATQSGPLVGELLFAMGSPESELGREPDEVQHSVLLSRLPLANTMEVTQADWQARMGPALPDSTFLGADLPVLGLTWYEAVAYCNALSSFEGRTPAYAVNGTDVDWDREADGWRLPTEAEWEWLCRAGSETAFTNGEITDQGCEDPLLDLVGWYCGNAGNAPRAVGGLALNAFDLADIHGNAMEWCWDWYAGYPGQVGLDPAGPAGGFLKVIRGGGWFNQAKACRSSARETCPPDSRLDYVGLRVVRTDFGN
jgi:formylglycine-generating enzyme required for sulfatase activity